MKLLLALAALAAGASAAPARSPAHHPSRGPRPLLRRELPGLRVRGLQITTVEGLCPCDGPGVEPAEPWANRGAYLQCVKQAAVELGLSPQEEQEAARADCGKAIEGEESVASEESEGSGESEDGESEESEDEESVESEESEESEGSGEGDKICEEVSETLCDKKWGGVCIWDGSACVDNPDGGQGGGGGGEGEESEETEESEESEESEGSGDEEKVCATLTEDVCDTEWGCRCVWDSTEGGMCKENPEGPGCGQGGGGESGDESEESEPSEGSGEGEKVCEDLATEGEDVCSTKWGCRCAWVTESETCTEKAEGPGCGQGGGGESGDESDPSEPSEGSSDGEKNCMDLDTAEVCNIEWGCRCTWDGTTGCTDNPEGPGCGQGGGGESEPSEGSGDGEKVCATLAEDVCDTEWGCRCLWDDNLGDSGECTENPEGPGCGQGGGGESEPSEGSGEGEKICADLSTADECNTKWGCRCLWEADAAETCGDNPDETPGCGQGGGGESGDGDKNCEVLTAEGEDVCNTKWGCRCLWVEESCGDNPDETPGCGQGGGGESEPSEGSGEGEKICSDLDTEDVCNTKWGCRCLWDSTEGGKCTENPEGPGCGQGGGGESEPSEGSGEGEKICADLSTADECNTKWGCRCLWVEESCGDNPDETPGCGQGGGGEGGESEGSEESEESEESQESEGSGDGEKDCKSITLEALCKTKWGAICEWDSTMDMCDKKDEPEGPGQSKTKNCGRIRRERQCKWRWGGICKWEEGDGDDGTCVNKPDTEGPGGGQGKGRDCGKIKRKGRCSRKWDGACKWEDGKCKANGDDE